MLIFRANIKYPAKFQFSKRVVIYGSVFFVSEPVDA